MILGLQEFIHRLEVGAGTRVVRIILGTLVVLVLMAGYNFRGYKNMATQEAMDAAQLGRNISRGKGYTTLFIRPLSVYLLSRRNAAAPTGPTVGATDPARLKTAHPDLANPPVYPLILAGLMKILPFDYAVDLKSSFWSEPRMRMPSATETPLSYRQFWRYEPDFVIALFNQLMLLLLVVLTFMLARRLFDSAVAWVSSLLLLGTEQIWRFTVSGLSTMVLLLILMALLWCLVLFEQEAREPKRSPRAVWLLAAACGVCVGLGALTRYAFGWMILPVLGFVCLVATQKRFRMSLVALLAFAVVLGPWVGRNVAVSGVPFGTATYTVLESTGTFPEDRLERSLEPPLRISLITAGRIAVYKLIANSRQTLQNDLPRLGGTWVASFFLVGLLVPFRNPIVRRLRHFALASVVLLAIVQALGRTQLSEQSADINGENLLVLLLPLVLAYGTALFFLVLDNIYVPYLELRYAIVALFALIVSLPLFLVFLPPKTIPVAYPPYYPPSIQLAVGWTRPDELIMSDIPWAVAWYGDSQCIWLTLKVQPDFYTINDYLKPVQELYLTHFPTQGRFMTLGQWVGFGEQGWRSFIIDAMARKSAPPGFPLQYLQPGWPEYLLVTYRKHYPKGS